MKKVLSQPVVIINCVQEIQIKEKMTIASNILQKSSVKTMSSFYGQQLTFVEYRLTALTGLSQQQQEADILI